MIKYQVEVKGGQASDRTSRLYRSDVSYRLYRIQVVDGGTLEIREKIANGCCRSMDGVIEECRTLIKKESQHAQIH